MVIQEEPASYWSWREYGIEAHPIRPKAKRAMAGALGHPITGPVRHPGVPARESWSEAMDDVAAAYPKLVDRAFDKAVG